MVSKFIKNRRKLKVKSKNCAIIITDHNHLAVRKISDEVGILKERRILRINNTDEDLKMNGYYAEEQ